MGREKVWSWIIGGDAVTSPVLYFPMHGMGEAFRLAGPDCQQRNWDLGLS